MSPLAWSGIKPDRLIVIGDRAVEVALGFVRDGPIDVDANAIPGDFSSVLENTRTAGNAAIRIARLAIVPIALICGKGQTRGHEIRDDRNRYYRQTHDSSPVSAFFKRIKQMAVGCYDKLANR
jgi:hypothetical protein